MDPKSIPGGTAFPFDEKEDDGRHYHGNPGMSLRDYFAAKAMHSLMSDPTFSKELQRMGKPIAASISTAAYVMADAMLESRQ